LGVVRNISEGLSRLVGRTDKAFRNDFDGGRQRRRLKTWQPTQNTVNTILSSSGPLLRARCRDALRNLWKGSGHLLDGKGKSKELLERVRREGFSRSKRAWRTGAWAVHRSFAALPAN